MHTLAPIQVQDIMDPHLKQEKCLFKKRKKSWNGLLALLALKISDGSNTPALPGVGLIYRIILSVVITVNLLSRTKLLLQITAFSLS